MSGEPPSWNMDDEAMRRILSAMFHLDVAELSSTQAGESTPTEIGSPFDGAEAELALKPARELGEGSRLGRFRLERELGRGGFGVVYLAFDERLGRRLALKTPRPDRVQNAALWKRFAREARLAAALDHPSIVPVLEAGVVDGVAFIASSYQEGRTLSHWIAKARRGFPPKFAARIAEQLAEGLTHAHQRGVLHRDLKPANVIMIGEPPGSDASFPSESSVQARITDFGLGSFHMGDDGTTLTGLWMGSPPYMAPEQALASNHPIDVRTDVYALGAILYELLTGRPIYPCRDLTDLAIRLSRGESSPPPRHLRRGIPRDLETICLKCLAHEPTKRYPSAAMLLDDLRRQIDGRPIAARRTTAPERLGRWAKRNPSLAALAGVLILGAMVGETLMIRHNAELSASNVRLESVNQQLADSITQLDAAKDQIQTTLDEVRDQGARLRLEVYASDLAAADSFLAANDAESAQLALLRQAPVPGKPDLREFAWRLLWSRATGDFSTHLLNRNTGWHRTGLAPDLAPNWWTGLTIAAQTENPDEFHLDRLGPRIGTDSLSCLPHRNGLYARWDQVANIVRIGEGDAEPEPLEGRGGTPRLAPDGRTLALADPKRPLKSIQKLPRVVRERQRLSSGKEIDVIRLPAAARLTLSADGQTAALLTPLPGTKRCAPLVYDLTTGRGRIFPRFARPAMIRRYNGGGRYREIQTEIAVSADGARLAISGEAERLEVFDARDGRSLWRKTEADDFAGAAVVVQYLAFSPNGDRLVSSDSTGRVLLWDAATGERLGEAPFSPHISGSVGFYPDNDTVVALAPLEERLRSWPIAPGPPSRATFDHGDEVWALTFIPGTSLLASAGDDHLIRLWDVDQNALKSTLHGHETLVTAIATPPDGRILVSGDLQGNLRLWDLEAAEAPPRPLTSISGRARAMRWSPDGRHLAVGGDSGRVLVWERATDRWVSLKTAGKDAYGVAWSPDGSILAAGGHQRLINLWSFPNGSPRGAIDARVQITSVQFTPDGSTLIVGAAGGGLRSWRLGRLDEPQISLERNSRLGGIWGLVCGPDGRTLAGGLDDGRVFLWDPDTLQQICRINAHQAKVYALAFSPDGRKLATADFNGKILIHSGLDTVGPLQLPPSPR